jgi:hypothetical protein
MRAIVVLSFDLPTPEDISKVILSIDPPSLPHFANEARIAVMGDAQYVLDWLDEAAHPSREEGGALTEPKEGT